MPVSKEDIMAKILKNEPIILDNYDQLIEFDLIEIGKVADTSMCPSIRLFKVKYNLAIANDGNIENIDWPSFTDFVHISFLLKRLTKKGYQMYVEKFPLHADD